MLTSLPSFFLSFFFPLSDLLFRARTIYNNVSSFPPCIYPQKKLSLPPSCFSAIYVPPLKNIQKNSCLYLDHIEISSTFAPAFREMVSLEIDILTATVYELHQISLLCPSFLLKVGHWKRKKKKTFENIWKLCNKVLTFAPAFRKEAIEWLTTWTEAWCLELYLFRFSFISLSPRETTRKRKWKKLPKIFGRYT